MNKILLSSMFCICLSFIFNGCVKDEISDLEINTMNPFDPDYVGENYLKIDSIELREWIHSNNVGDLLLVHYSVDWNKLPHLSEEALRNHNVRHVFQVYDPFTNQLYGPSGNVGFTRYSYTARLDLPLNTASNWTTFKFKIYPYEQKPLPNVVDIDDLELYYELTYEL